MNKAIQTFDTSIDAIINNLIFIFLMLNSQAQC